MHVFVLFITHLKLNTSLHIVRAGLLRVAKRKQYFIGHLLYYTFADKTPHYIFKLFTYVDRNPNQARLRERGSVKKIQHTELGKCRGRSL